MSRYFFDICDDAGLQRDEHGVELADLTLVRKEAQRVLPNIASDDARSGSGSGAYTMLVRDEEGRSVYSASLTFKGNWIAR